MRELLEGLKVNNILCVEWSLICPQGKQMIFYLSGHPSILQFATSLVRGNKKCLEKVPIKEH